VNWADFLSIDFLKVALPAAAAIITWVVNEWRRRAHEDYVRKEARYLELLKALRGFYVETQDSAMKQSFVDELTRCWLYCPDGVIRKAYAFLDTVRVGAKTTAVKKEQAAGDLVAALRCDLLGRRLLLWRRTSLTGTDYQHIRAT
jgi:hypothetical protein